MFLHSSLSAQVYTKGKTRHRFAQLVLGADLVSFPASGQTYDVNALCPLSVHISAESGWI